MEKEEFLIQIIDKTSKIGLKLEIQQIEKLYAYMNLLLEWNEKMNLTAIIDPREIIVKHFIDSLTISKEIKEKQKVLDIGTGAGFPGIPLSIIKGETQFTLVDSLNKRLLFLEEVLKKLQLNNVILVHARAEEFGRDKKERESYDVVTSRAVASMNILLEYMLPLVKVGGTCICMKGPKIEEELQKAKTGLMELGGEIIKIESITLPDTNITRNIVEIKKTKETPLKYPRKAGIPSKNPL